MIVHMMTGVGSIIVVSGPMTVTKFCEEGTKTTPPDALCVQHLIKHTISKKIARTQTIALTTTLYKIFDKYVALNAIRYLE